MRLKSLRGRLIGNLIPIGGARESGIIVVDRKGITTKAEVVAVGNDSMSVKGKKLKSPAKIGDIIYFRQHTSKTHKAGMEGHRKGLMTIWWEDIILVVSGNELKPTYENVLVKSTYKARSSLIIMPDIVKKREEGFYGEVIAIGEDYPYDLKVGETVVFGRHEGIPVEINEEEHLILKPIRILGKLK